MPPYTTVLDSPPSPANSVADAGELNNKDAASASDSDDADSGVASVDAAEEYPFEWVPISRQERMSRREVYFSTGPWCVSPKASMLDLVRSSPGRVLMPAKFAEIARRVYEFAVRPDDVFVVTYPKCGTTWTQEMVWQILHDLDPEAGKESLLTRSPFLEMQALSAEEEEAASAAVSALEAARTLPSPRVIKTHLPIDMLPPSLLDVGKVVFVARNPMDCCVSFYHHERLVPQQGFAGTFDQYAQLFREGNNPTGDYFYHLKSGWSRRDHPNLKFVWYEDMKFNIRETIRDLCDFLDHPLSQDQIRDLQSHLHIDNFRKNKSVNMESNYAKEKSRGQFIRRGSVGGWRGYFSQERVEDWKIWVSENTKGTGLEFCLD